MTFWSALKIGWNIPDRAAMKHDRRILEDDVRNSVRAKLGKSRRYWIVCTAS